MKYEALVSREDYKQNIPRALRKIADWRGKNIAELGAGTGRLTLILATESKSILTSPILSKISPSSSEGYWNLGVPLIKYSYVCQEETQQKRFC
ncbi:MAG: hypothetical protein WC421_09710, partial [Elusimicrobiales bacterium]